MAPSLSLDEVAVRDKAADLWRLITVTNELIQTVSPVLDKKLADPDSDFEEPPPFEEPPSAEPPSAEPTSA